jgi:hypothetical protein
MVAQCPLCHEVRDDPREACPSCGSKLAAEALKLHERDTTPLPLDYRRYFSHPSAFEVAGPRGELVIEADLGEVYAPSPVIASTAGIARMSDELMGRYVDPTAVERLADFGPRPAHWYDAPKYAQQVRARLVTLEVELKGAEKRADLGRTALDDALVTTGLRGIAWMKTTMRPARNSYLKTIDNLTKRENELKAVDATVVQNTETAREALVDVLEKINGARRANAGGVDALAQERDTIERSVRVPAKSLDPTIERARGDFRTACTDFARFILDDRAVFGVDFDDLRASIARLREVADAAELRLQMHGAALDAFDHGAVALGKGVVIVAIVLAVVAVAGGVAALV